MKNPIHPFRPRIALSIPLLLFWLCWWMIRTPRDVSVIPSPKAVQTSLTNGMAASAQFQQWVTEWSQTPADQRMSQGQREKGLALAQLRRQRMAKLIRENPAQAIREALPLHEWATLPEEIRSVIEEPFSMRGDFQYLPICPEPGTVIPSGMPDHLASLSLADGSSLDTFSYGQRAFMMSKRGIPAQGVKIDGVAAVREEVLQVLKPEDVAIAKSIYPMGQSDPKLSFATGKPLAEETVWALAGGKVFGFADAAEVDELNVELAKLDQLPGPDGGSGLMFVAAYSTEPSKGFALAEAKSQGIVTSSTWTETKKKVFLVRVDFSDNTGAAFTQTQVADALNGAASSQILAMSYGKSYIEGSVSANVYRMPSTAAFYVNSPAADSRNDQLIKDARNIFRNTKSGADSSVNIGPVGTNSTGDNNGLGNFDIVGVVFKGIGMKGSGVNYAGLAGIGVGTFWIQNTLTDYVYVHEFGHNYGLGHASFWKTNDGSSVGTGATVEYGDEFDIMGDGGLNEGHLHPQAKALLNWITPSQWTDGTASGSGTHRIFRIDDPTTVGTKRGVRVTKALGEYYWIGYRPAYTLNPYLKRGAYLNWQRPSSNRCWLVDTVPATSGDVTDSPIQLGKTYADATANVFITPLAVGGSGSEQYIDVRVNLGPFPGNAPPLAGAISGPSNVSARTVALFSVSPTDANGDPLSYHWDFGDGMVNDNTASQAHVFPIGGSYTVKVTVTDMKGGTSLGTKVVTVSDPVQTWIQRTSDTTKDFKAIAANSSTVVACGGNGGLIRTSTDGVTWTTVTVSAAGNVFFNGITWTGTQFIAVGQDYDFDDPAGWVGVIYTSPTGAAWTRRLEMTPRSTELTGIAVNGSGVGAVALASGKSGTVMRSVDDGLTWTSVSLASTGLTASHNATGLAYGNGVFVLTSYQGGNGNGRVISSTDGLSWTDRTSGVGLDLPSNNDVRHLAFLNDRFVASGWYSSIRTSIDNGVSFATTRSDREMQPGLAFGDRIYFTCGENLDAAEEVNVISMDGVNWTSFDSPTTTPRKAATIFKNTFITVGQGGEIWQSGNTSPSTAYAGWQITHFPTGGLESLPHVDKDLDGCNNLIEHCFSRNPHSGTGNDGSGGMGSPVHASNRVWLRLDMPEPAPSDVTYIVQGNTSMSGSWTNLATKVGTGEWSWVGGGTSRLSIGAANAGRVPVDVGTPDSASSGARYYLRLSVAIP